VTSDHNKEALEIIARSTPAGNDDLEPIEKVVLRCMNEGVIILECNGDIHGVNAAALRLLGMQESDLTGRRFYEAFGPDDLHRDLRDIVEAVVERSQATTRAEVSFLRPDGQSVDLAISTASLEHDTCRPAMQTAVVVLRDITALKNIEKVRRRAVDHLSHELKTPISIIQASLSGTEADEAGHVTMPAKRLDRIRRNLSRLVGIQQIVEEVLNPPENHPVRLRADITVRDILESIKQECTHRDVHIRTRLQPAETENIDPRILEQTVRTLVKNAVESTPDEGEIDVNLCPDDDGHVVLTVEDHGVGITVQDTEFIFDGFHHTQDTDEYSTKKPYDFNAGGKGLELLRLKVLAESGFFDMSFRSQRCRFIPTSHDHCPGRISNCPHIAKPDECTESGGTFFTVGF
jgi:two-component system phosphate regulon sensor histidine kinase PhoR